MGFFDTVKDKAGSIAADAERAGKVTAAQARLVVLQNDLRKAERELGHAAFALVERGELGHPDLAHAVERLRATAAEVRAKEAEISALRGEQLEMRTSAGAAHVPPAAPATTSGPAAPTATVVATPSGPVTVTSGPLAASEPPAAAEQTADAAAERPADALATAEAPAEPAGGDAVAADAEKPKPHLRSTKGGAGAAAGSTPKKTPRPSSRGKTRKAGKKPDSGPH